MLLHDVIMTRWENYLAAAEKIIGEYDGSLPLHHFLKGYFKQHPYMGSRDRRHISQLVYSYYRLGWLYKEEKSVQERILLGSYLCKTEEADNFTIEAPAHISYNDIFPYSEALSPGIDPAAFAQSFLKQPFLFIRTRKDKQEAIKKAAETRRNRF